ncbi:MAG: hypothetical protein JSS60_05535 [Verrucomicrobia bacterium]|nr:hypothetical protein [Verrucomicrobiota bacterium]
MDLKSRFANLNYKQIAGIIVLIGGIVLFFLTVNATKKIADATTLSQSISNYFEHNPDWNPIIKFFGGKAQEKITYYSTMVLLIQIGSVVLTALGAVMIVLFRKKNTPGGK